MEAGGHQLEDRCAGPLSRHFRGSFVHFSSRLFGSVATIDWAGGVILLNPEIQFNGTNPYKLISQMVRHTDKSMLFLSQSHELFALLSFFIFCPFENAFTEAHELLHEVSILILRS